MPTVLVVIAGVVALALLVLAVVLLTHFAPQLRRQAILANELRAAAQLDAVTRSTIEAMRQLAREHSGQAPR